MKFNLSKLKNLFSTLNKTGVADDVAKIATGSVDDFASTALDVVDDIPKVYTLSPETIPNLKYPFGDFSKNSIDTLGTFDLGSGGTPLKVIDTPEILSLYDANFNTGVPAKDLVFQQFENDPDTLLIRPHNNTALGKWYQNKMNALPKRSIENITPEQFVEEFLKRRQGSAYDTDLPL